MLVEERTGLPKGWARTTLGSIRLDLGKSVVPNKTPNQMFELYSIPAFESGQPEIVSGKEIGSNKQTVNTGTVLVSKINPRINRIWIVSNHSQHQKIASTEWIPFFKQEGIDSEYLCYFMRTDSFRDYLNANVSGVGGSLMRVRPTVVDKYTFLFPPFPEQRRIVSKIDELFSDLDVGVSSLKKAKAEIARFRQSVLAHAFSGKLTDDWRKTHGNEVEPAAALLERICAERTKSAKTKRKETPTMDASDLPELPEGWTWVRLMDFVYEVKDGTHDTPRYVKNGIPFVTQKNIREHGFDMTNINFISQSDHEKFYQRSNVAAGDIIISMIGHNRGMSCIVTSSKSFSIKNVGLVKHFEHLNNNAYVAWYMKSQIGQRIIQSQSKGGAQAFIGLTELRNWPICVTNIKEQHQIVSEIDRRFSIINSMEKTIDTSLLEANRLRQSILKRAFEGKLVPQDPRDEPANILLERIKKEKT
jgi:type I restriction enzyme, S subunit